MTTAHADRILLSRNIFTGIDDTPFSGFVATSGDSILALGAGDGSDFKGPETIVRDFGDGVICPGFIDSHCFFTGYALQHIGADLADSGTLDAALVTAERHAASRSAATVLGHNWKGAVDDAANALVDKRFPDQAVVIFTEGGETCIMNAAARERYGCTPETCYPEAMWRLLDEMMHDRDFIVPMFRQYMRLMNSRGVTSVKEMGFDDYYGFTDVLSGLEQDHALTIRVSFMSQPVGRAMDIDFGKAMRNRFGGEFVRFSGFNRMTDGSIGQHQGDLKQPYEDLPGVCCGIAIDYDRIEKDMLVADAEGFRFSLHAQGDAAVARILDMYEKCQKDESGKLVNRHAITDLELSDPADLPRMGRLGVIAEIYPQIPTLYTREEKVALIRTRVGDRGRFYWNRRTMADSGVVISCATDLPLLVDDIPESIYSACGGYFNDAGEPFNPENTVTVGELLRAWTQGGAVNLSIENMVGTLEKGKKADIAVLDGPVFSMNPVDVRSVRVAATYSGGREVYTR